MEIRIVALAGKSRDRVLAKGCQARKFNSRVHRSARRLETGEANSMTPLPSTSWNGPAQACPRWLPAGTSHKVDVFGVSLKKRLSALAPPRGYPSFQINEQATTWIPLSARSSSLVLRKCSNFC